LNKSTADKISKISLPQNNTMLQAMKKMDELKMKLLIVTDKRSFVSVISIGDIQRAIIKGKSFETKISEILREEITVCKADDSVEKIKAEMIRHRAEFMPVLNGKNEIVNVVFWKDIFTDQHSDHLEKLKLDVVIMAGGRGSRLKPITNVIPKPLVPFGDKTIIELIIDNFVKSGVSKFYLLVNYKANLIENYLNEIDQKDFDVEFIYEEQANGTAGSLSLLKNKIGNTFFVSNCDILIDQDYSEVLKFHIANKNELTIISALRHYSIPYGTLEVEAGGLLKSLREKPDLTYLINCGMYILEPHLLNEVPDNKLFHITDLIENIKKRKGRVGVFPVSEMSWIDIGDWKEYNRAQEIISKKYSE
jgi:dTDP-glucose pyrophosphorylase